MRNQVRRQAAGFTLIELMIIVALIGVLATVAMPSYRLLTLRAKTAERPLMLTTIKQAVQDIYVRQDALPPPGFINAPANPPGPPTSYKRIFNRTLGGWPSILPPEAGIEGTLYYSYTAWVQDIPGGASMFFIQADGDLDADTLMSFKQSFYLRQNGIWQLTAELVDDSAF